MKNHGFLPAATAALLILTACLAVADTTTNRYVVKDNPNAAPPYHAWTNAAPDIQTAIDAAIAANNDQVIVAPGVYDSGATWGGANSNRVYVKRGITVMSRDNDPATTIIKGAWDPVTTNGPQAVRCVFLEAAAKIIGFTLTNGATASFTNTVDRGGALILLGRPAAYPTA